MMDATQPTAAELVEAITKGIGSDYYTVYEVAIEAFATYRQRCEALEAENKVLRAFIGIKEDFPPITKVEDILNTPISEIMREPQIIATPLTARDFIEIAAKQKRFDDYLQSINQITVKDVDKSE